MEIQDWKRSAHIETVQQNRVHQSQVSVRVCGKHISIANVARWICGLVFVGTRGTRAIVFFSQ
eukprot:Gb_27936 [translate_table: standard]